MGAHQLCWLSAISFLLLLRLAGSYVKVTNIDCKALDLTFADFQKCRLNVPKRGTIAVSVHVRLYQVPVNNVSVNLSIFKKANGYRPFLYNISMDFCAFMANKKRVPFAKVFLDIIAKNSNINHTCPYNHDIIIKDLVVGDEAFKLMPLPVGDYMFKLMVGAYNNWKANIKTYFSIKLDR